MENVLANSNLVGWGNVGEGRYSISDCKIGGTSEGRGSGGWWD